MIKQIQYTCLYLQGTSIKSGGNIHAVSGGKISVHQFLFSEVNHSFGNLKTHIQHPFFGFTDLHVWITLGGKHELSERLFYKNFLLP